MIRRTACILARSKDPYRNLAIEKHLMETLPEDTAILYLWQNERTVLVGRCQNPADVCNLHTFMESGGQVARRLSGGGACYQDAGALGFTFILPKNAFDISHQLGIIGMACAACGIRPHASSRGRLMSGSKCFSVNAYYKSGSAAYHHGVIHVCSELGAMNRFMKMGGVQMTNLCDECRGLTVRGFEQVLCQCFAAGYRADPAWLDEMMMDQKSIVRAAEGFANRNWIFPELKTDHSFSVSEDFPWGSLTVRLKVDSGIIRAANIFTDAMEAPLFHKIESFLIGSPFLISAISGRFEQKLELLTDPRLMQLAGDVCKLICGCIRSQDRSGQSHDQPEE